GQTRDGLIHCVEIGTRRQRALLGAPHFGRGHQLHRLGDLHGGLYRFDTALDVLHISGSHCLVPLPHQCSERNLTLNSSMALVSFSLMSSSICFVARMVSGTSPYTPSINAN